MRKAKIQNLLAPAWLDRARADDSLFFMLAEIGEGLDDLDSWPAEILQELDALEPDPQTFFSALIGFWADYSAEQITSRMREWGGRTLSYDRTGWASACVSRFPMTPAAAPPSQNLLRSQSVWALVARLGRHGAGLEDQLLACLDHPEPVVVDAAEQALGTSDRLSDHAFECFLNAVDRRGSNGMIRIRARAVARHVDASRLPELLRGIRPGTSDSAFEGRLAVVGELPGDYARVAQQHLLDQINAWAGDPLARLIRALTRTSEKLGFEAEVVAAIKGKADHESGPVRSAVAWFLSCHDPCAHHHQLMKLVRDSEPSVRTSLCQGLSRHQSVAADLLRAMSGSSLGCYDAFDGEPHDSAVEVLLGVGEAIREAETAILVWWESAATRNNLDREAVANALDLGDALGAAALGMLAGFQRALSWLEAEEVELPSLDQPGAVEAIEDYFEQSMLDSGADPIEAKGQAAVQGAMLGALADNLDAIQADINAFDEALSAEERELYPELASQQDDEESADHEEDEYEDEEDEDEDEELVIRLRTTITRLQALQ